MHQSTLLGAAPCAPEFCDLVVVLASTANTSKHFNYKTRLTPVSFRSCVGQPVFNEPHNACATCGVNDHTCNTGMAMCRMTGRDDMHGAIEDSPLECTRFGVAWNWFSGGSGCQ